ncbi:MAG: RimK family alpha-L-glutamate ligase [Methanomassiliicoccales archaeon]|jgi:glutathione synthase/RimK-type ligase-like ATP-grasp enzyme|nr:RimK family alpha-L-glutamate ligase [Methanomassiliicoccales archaeon]
MANIACFVERYTINRSEELNALTNFKVAALNLGHRFDYIFRSDIHRIPEFDALFIRSTTDPMNASYVASRIAEMNGLTVIDDPDSIIICCDKINMYLRLQRSGLKIPETRFLDKNTLNVDAAQRIFEELGCPVVLKAPFSSFSTYVEKVENLHEFYETARRYFRRTSAIVAQRFVPSNFDWRVTTLNGEVLFVCKYIMPPSSWKIQHRENGHVTWARIQAMDLNEVDPELIETGIKASAAIGKGLYGVDIKEVDGEYLVIEVNDNPNIDAGGEDAKNPEVYERIIRYLAGE